MKLTTLTMIATFGLLTITACSYEPAGDELDPAVEFDDEGLDDDDLDDEDLVERSPICFFSRQARADKVKQVSLNLNNVVGAVNQMRNKCGISTKIKKSAELVTVAKQRLNQCGTKINCGAKKPELVGPDKSWGYIVRAWGLDYKGNYTPQMIKNPVIGQMNPRDEAMRFDLAGRRAKAVGCARKTGVGVRCVFKL